jgi:hypothetical protein
MGVLNKGTDFSNGDQVTDTNLDNLVDNATFTSSAVDGSTTDISGAGAIIVRDGGVTSSKLATEAVTTAKIATGALNDAEVTATGSTAARSLGDRFAEVVNVKDFGATGDGVTDDTAAIQAAYSAGAKQVLFPTGKYRITSTITIPENIVSVGDGYSSNYSNPTRDGGSQVLIDISTTDNAFELSGTSLQGYGCSFHGLTFTSHSNVASSDLSAQSINCFFLENIFDIQFESCIFQHLNVSKAIGTSGSCNVIDFSNCSFSLVGDTTSSLVALTGGYSYGYGIDCSAASDITIDNCFVEQCGQVGVRVSSNSKIVNSFIDLNNQGITFTGSNVVISNNSVKYSQQFGIQPAPDSYGFIISDCIIKGNNYANATGTGDATFGIRLTSGHSFFRIENINAVDELVAGHPDKTELQNFIHCGAAGNSGVISGVSIGDSATSGRRIFDSNNNIGLGNIVLNNIDISGASKSLTGLQLDSADTVSEIGFAKVNGSSSTRAITLGAGSIVNGVVQSNSNGTLMRAGRMCIGPEFISDSAPTTLVDKSSGSNSGAVGISGFSFPVSFSHTGSGGVESLNIVSLPDRAQGHITVVYGDGGTDSFLLTGTIKWDGTTLTTDIVTHNSGFGVPSLTNNSGSLAVSAAKAAAESGDMYVKFSGFWAEV